MTVNALTTSARSKLARALILPALMPVAFAAAQSQQPQPATPVSLSLGDAARLASKQNAAAVAARYRAEQADARVTQRRADLLPKV